VIATFEDDSERSCGPQQTGKIVKAQGEKLVAGNWKMNGLLEDGSALAGELVRLAADRPPPAALLVCPPATLLSPIGQVLCGSGIALGGQDCHAAPKGAYTGDISAEMLADLGCRYVILGHSERRGGHGESDAAVREKVAAAWRAGLAAILCVGESREERAAGRALATVKGQIAGSLPEGASAERFVLAYEPVWAIGTGLVASAADIGEMHAAIRPLLPPETRILYGGSVNRQNAAEILKFVEVDGALVGGASLNAADFMAIAHACE
jgi:triosephosphate isomerase (TIM)